MLPVRQQIGLVLFQQTEESVVNVFILRHVILQRQRLQEHGKDQVQQDVRGRCGDQTRDGDWRFPHARRGGVPLDCGATEAPSPSQLTPMQNAALRLTLSSVSAKPAMAAG